MAAVLGRIKNAFRKGPRAPKLPPGAYPHDGGSEDGIGTIRKPPYPSEDDDDDDDEDYRGVQNYNVPEQDRLRQQRETIRSDDSNHGPNSYGKARNTSTPTLNPPSSAFRGGSGGFAPSQPMNNNTNNNIQNLSATNNRSSPYPGFPPGMNPNQGPSNSSQPTGGGFPPVMNLSQKPSNNSQPPSGGFPFNMNPNQGPPNNSQPPSGGFLPGMNLNQGPSNNSQPPSGGFPPGMNLNQGPSNNSQPPSGGFPPDMNLNQKPSNNSQPPSGGFPFNMNPNQGPPKNSQPPSGGFLFNMNSNQTRPPSNLGMDANRLSPPSALTNPQSSDFSRPPAINLSQTQPPANPGVNPNKTTPSPSIFSMLPGIDPVAPNTTSNLPTNNSNNMMNTHQGSLPANTSAFRNLTDHNNDDDNVSRLELDYPIENVLIDANIPSKVAIKINEAIERDRLGHAFHIHRYTFEPPTPQHISFGNNQHTNHHAINKPHHGGTRHIREIPDGHQNFSFDNFNHSQKANRHSRRRHHHDSDASLNNYVEQLLYPLGSVVINAQNSNDVQHLLQQHISNNQIIPLQSSANSFLPNNNTITEPIFYYTARALPNDPMRIH